MSKQKFQKISFIFSRIARDQPYRQNWQNRQKTWRLKCQRPQTVTCLRPTATQRHTSPCPRPRPDSASTRQSAPRTLSTNQKRPLKCRPCQNRDSASSPKPMIFRMWSPIYDVTILPLNKKIFKLSPHSSSLFSVRSPRFFAFTLTFIINCTIYCYFVFVISRTLWF